MWRVLAATLAAVSLTVMSAEAWAFKPTDCATKRPLSTVDRALLLMQHLPSGLPSDDEVLLVRRAYVMEYDPVRRVPRWAAWLARQEYRDTPERKGRWKTFHPDPDLEEPVLDKDYNGLYDDGKGLARGHIVPYFISGGDRDADGMDAEVEDVKGQPVEDPDDACTVFEVNYMSNIAPQHHNRFNGRSGLWWKLEKTVRGLLDSGHVLHLIAGSVFEDSMPEILVGPNKRKIQVPHGYFKIIVTKSGVVAFLFGHDTKGASQGCGLDSQLIECVQSVAKIQEITGLNFFSALPGSHQKALEAEPNKALWLELATVDE